MCKHKVHLYEIKSRRNYIYSWIDMKNVQISEELFVAIMRYFMLEQEELLLQIKQGLEKKLDAMVMRELYTKYKTALTEEEKEKARKEYLDR